MAIVRFVDFNGEVHHGIERGPGEAEIIDTLFEPHRTNGKLAKVDRVLAPLMPANIFGIGLNYRRHADETGQTAGEHPTVFMKPTSAVIGPGESILLPSCCQRGPEVDYECELAVIIGNTARNVSEADALDYILGYTCANDVSARRWQKQSGNKQWVRGKSFDTFCPLGPRILTTDEIEDPQRLALSTTINGVRHQASNTADMIFSVRQLVSFLSLDTTLLPGTVILTGTPEGVGFVRKPPVFLKAGDVVTVEIEQIGRLQNTVEDAQ